MLKEMRHALVRRRAGAAFTKNPRLGLFKMRVAAAINRGLSVVSTAAANRAEAMVAEETMP